MKKILLIIGLGLSVFGQENYNEYINCLEHNINNQDNKLNCKDIEIKPYMDCEDIKAILPNIRETKLLIQYQNNIICKAIMEDENGCLIFKYDLNYKTKKFEIIQNRKNLVNKLQTQKYEN